MARNLGQTISINDLLVIIIGILAVSFNGVLLVSMLRNKATIFTSNGAYLVANLAVADLLTGASAVRYGILHEQGISTFVDGVLLSLFWTSVQVSILTIFIMSLERYLAIVFPFQAEKWLTKKRTLQCIVVTWFLSCLSGVLRTFYENITMLSLSVFFELTVLVTLFLYYKIFVVLAKRKKANAVNLGLLPQREALHEEIKRESRLTDVVVILTAIMVITVLTYMIALQVYILYDLSSPGHLSSAKLFVVYYLPVELSNFVINPIVYAWRLPKYRHALLQTLKCW